jgi:hypothetical protein
MRISETHYAIGSTEYLALIAKHDCYVVLERSFPAGRLKRDLVTIKDSNGRDLELMTPQGFKRSPIELPREMLDDFIRWRFVEQDGPQDRDGRTTFRVTGDGRERGLS